MDMLPLLSDADYEVVEANVLSSPIMNNLVLPSPEHKGNTEKIHNVSMYERASFVNVLLQPFVKRLKTILLKKIHQIVQPMNTG